MMRMQCDDIDVMLYDAMSGELTNSMPDSLGYRPKELMDSHRIVWVIGPQRKKENDTKAAKKEALSIEKGIPGASEMLLALEKS